jgi:hypothetical protein
MNLADVLTVVLIVLALLTVFVALWLLTAGLFPRLAQGCAERIGTSPLACSVVGLIALLPVIALGLLLSRAAPNALGRLVAALVFIGTLLAALVGSTGLALRLGRGLAAEDDARAPWHQVRRGGVVLALTFLLVVTLPLVLIPGLGSLLLALRGDNRPAATPTA